MINDIASSLLAAFFNALNPCAWTAIKSNYPNSLQWDFNLKLQ